MPIYTHATLDLGDVERGLEAMRRRVHELKPAFQALKTPLRLDQRDHAQQRSRQVAATDQYGDRRHRAVHGAGGGCRTARPERREARYGQRLSVASAAPAPSADTLAQQISSSSCTRPPAR